MSIYRTIAKCQWMSFSHTFISCRHPQQIQWSSICDRFSSLSATMTSWPVFLYHRQLSLRRASSLWRSDLSSVYFVFIFGLGPSPGAHAIVRARTSFHAHARRSLHDEYCASTDYDSELCESPNPPLPPSPPALPPSLHVYVPRPFDLH